MAYDLTLEEIKVKPHQVTTLHMVCALAYIVAGAIIFVYNYTITNWGVALFSAGILLTIITMFKNKWATGKGNTTLRAIELIITLSIDGYSILQQWRFPIVIFSILGAALLFGLFWERSSGNTLSVHIDESGLKLPVTARQRFLKWTEVEEVLLRFGILSVNTVDNRLFQWTITGPEVSQEAFETYCSRLVDENRGKRAGDNW